MVGLLGVSTVIGITMPPLYPCRFLLSSERIVVNLIKQSEISVYSLSCVTILAFFPKSSVFYIGKYIFILLFETYRNHAQIQYWSRISVTYKHPGRETLWYINPVSRS